MTRATITKLLLSLLCLIGMIGCGDDSSPVAPPFSDPDSVEPTAGAWKTYVLIKGSSFRPGAPPNADATQQELAELRDLAGQRTDAIKAGIDFWNGGTIRRWNEYQRDLIKKNSANPPRASRGLALVSVAMYDAMVAAWDCKYHYLRARPFDYENSPAIYGTRPHSPAYVSERAAIGAAASEVLKYLFPNDADSIGAKFEESKLTDLYAGTHFRSDVTVGEQLGKTVAQLVLQRAQTDNSGSTYSGNRLTGPGYWEPTPPAFVQNPLEPACGQWKPWILPNGSAVRPGPPPAYNSPEFTAQLHEVWDVNQNLTQQRRDIAVFWADGAGTVTPPGHWNQIAIDLAVEQGMNEPRQARMLALLGVAQADAFIAAWDCKYFYWCVRPITEVRKALSVDWLSPIATPPFPSYPSGHSTTSGAAATVLAYLFPDDAVELQREGVEAMNSRLYGGIHFSFDNLTGFNMGVAIATRAIARAADDGSPGARMHVPGDVASR